MDMDRTTAIKKGGVKMLTGIRWVTRHSMTSTEPVTAASTLMMAMITKRGFPTMYAKTAIPRGRVPAPVEIQQTCHPSRFQAALGYIQSALQNDMETFHKKIKLKRLKKTLELHNGCISL